MQYLILAVALLVVALVCLYFVFKTKYVLVSMRSYPEGQFRRVYIAYGMLGRMKSEYDIDIIGKLPWWWNLTTGGLIGISETQSCAGALVTEYRYSNGTVKQVLSI